jgi:hypothetical protein
VTEREAVAGKLRAVAAMLEALAVHLERGTASTGELRRRLRGVTTAWYEAHRALRVELDATVDAAGE